MQTDNPCAHTIHIVFRSSRARTIPYVAGDIYFDMSSVGTVPQDVSARPVTYVGPSVKVQIVSGARVKRERRVQVGRGIEGRGGG